VGFTTQDKLNILLNSENEIEIKRLDNRMYRVGFCSRCGSCCKEININTLASDTVMDWLAGYGIKCRVRPKKFLGLDEDRAEAHSITMSIPITCKYLSEDGEVTTCTRHENRPAICQFYPRKPSKHPNCTYLFLNTEQLQVFLEQIKSWENEHGASKKTKHN